MEKKITVTKDKIKKYLKNYIYLTQLIKARELNWIIGRGPSFQEWQEGVNTVELQAINLIEDEKLAELRFYRNYIHKYMLVSEDVRDKKIYKYFIFKYVQNYNENLIHNI